MGSWATIDDLVRQRAALGEAANRSARRFLGAVERARRAATFDRTRAARTPFAVDSHVSAAQMNRTTAGRHAAGQLRARRGSLVCCWAAASPRAVDGARRSRVAIDCAAGLLSQAIDLARRVGSAANSTNTRGVAANDVTGNARRAASRSAALAGAARDDARRGVAASPGSGLRRAAEGSAAERAASTEHPARRAAARGLAIRAQRVGILNAAPERSRNQHREHSHHARTLEDHASGPVCHVAEGA